mgnify:CR=1 FL=1
MLLFFIVAGARGYVCAAVRVQYGGIRCCILQSS